MSEDFVPFAQERVMSKWENVVDYNLGDSGVHPMTAKELIDDPEVIEEVLSTGLYHPQANGILELREHIASLYPGATPDNVLVTSGAAQANFTSIWTLLKPGDEIVVTRLDHDANVTPWVMAAEDAGAPVDAGVDAG